MTSANRHSHNFVVHASGTVAKPFYSDPMTTIIGSLTPNQHRQEHCNMEAQQETAMGDAPQATLLPSTPEKETGAAGQMPDSPIIELCDINKEYVINIRRYGLKSMLLHFPRYISDRCNPVRHKVLKNFDLKIQRGESIGVIGANGSGKTTLLSIIAGVVKNYTGERRVHGRISMMLALTSGFEKELSGRENIILNGVLQGMSRKAMLHLMDDIIDFADIGEFIDAPVYQYSSGMQARLGFAIATAIKPEILLIDEVMAVGDEDFKQKCKKRMKALLADGVTLLLVSHKMSDIKLYCNRVVCIEKGRKLHDMPTADFFAMNKISDN